MLGFGSSVVPTCPQCRTTTDTNPKLLLRYSSCCGDCLCNDCVQLLFSSSDSKHSQVPCPVCGSLLLISDWSAVPLSTQRFSREVKHRHRLNRLMILEAADFKDPNDYENYVELKQDLIYDLTEGDKQTVKEAEKRLADWQRENQSLIDRAASRQVAKERMDQLKSQGKLDLTSSDRPLSLAPVIPSFSLPIATMKPSLLRDIEGQLSSLQQESNHHQNHHQSDHLTDLIARLKDQRRQLLFTGRRSGGWMEKFGRRREEEEMREGWNHNRNSQNKEQQPVT